jgi:hypothetical protein
MDEHLERIARQKLLEPERHLMSKYSLVSNYPNLELHEPNGQLLLSINASSNGPLTELLNHLHNGDVLKYSADA